MREVEYKNHIQEHEKYPVRSVVDGWIITKSVPKYSGYEEGCRIQYILRESIKDKMPRYFHCPEQAIEFIKTPSWHAKGKR